MSSAYDQLVIRFNRLAQIEHSLTFLQWDQLVMMPPGGNDARSDAIAELSTLYHELLTAADMVDLIERAKVDEHAELRQNSIREIEREYRWAACIPADLVKAKSLAGSRCEHQWRTQRKDNDWFGFLKNFKEVVALARQEAQARQDFSSGAFQTPYDAMLDLYCTGDSSAFISEVFSVLKEKLPPLISVVVEKQAGRTRRFDGTFPVADQKRLNQALAAALGFRFEEGRIDESSHPFSTGGHGDHRITSRYREDDFIDALKATAHETGHSAYESGLPIDWKNLPAGQARNMCLHESQSLLFEKQIFLSKPFLNCFAPTVHRHLEASRSYNCEQIWLNSIKVDPTLIRVEADEISYPLHVILRYELESALINGTMEPGDIPEAWDEKMLSYLGLSTVENYRDGCLQDIHWTDGSFGYFPAYTIGALNGVQIFSAYCRAFPDWQDQFAQGDVGTIRGWLQEVIWSQGRFLESQELMQAATGEHTNPDYFLSYIKERYLTESY